MNLDAEGRDGDRDGIVRPRPALLSVVTPAYNEAEGLPKLIEELRAVLETLADEYEIIVVDDGSKDETLEVLVDLQRADRRVKWVALWCTIRRREGLCMWCGTRRRWATPEWPSVPSACCW